MKANRAKVSICITYYNQQEYVRQSLDSVLAIEYPCDIEILCGDDGSSDETVNILEEYSKKYPNRIKYFVWDRTETGKTINRASANRLRLARLAAGDYIIFLDGDDYYCDTLFVKEAIAQLQKASHISACAFAYKNLYEDGRIETAITNCWAGEIDPKRYIAERLYIPAAAIVFRNILSSTDIDSISKINNFDDNVITIFMLRLGSMFYVNKPVFVYRQSANSIWNTASEIERRIINALEVGDEFVERMIAWPNIDILSKMYANIKWLKYVVLAKYAVLKINLIKFLKKVM